METIEQPVAEVVETPAASISEHASRFGPDAQVEATEETADETAARVHHSAQQRRDKENGEFRSGKVRHRAASQQATSADVPRIQQLTAQKKTAEERVAALEAEVATLKRSHAPAAAIAKAETKLEAAQPETDAEPDENNPKYAGKYPEYLKDQARWAGRDAYRQEQQRAKDDQAKAARADSDRAVLKGFADKVEAAKLKYPDFEAVAFGPTVIPSGSVPDAWIMEHRGGADVLYYLNSPSHRQELDSLLAKPVLEQVEDLTLLSQRLLSSPSQPAGTTGSAAGRQMIVLPPRPPNPVRTEAHANGETPPKTDGSLSIAEHARAFGPKHR